jgi:hypothetical protein
MNTPVHYERPAKRSPHDLVMDRLHRHARRLITSGAFRVSLSAARALGRGDPVRGEDILHRLFAMEGALLIHRDEVRRLGNGSIAAGRKVLQRFLDRAEASPAQYQSGGAVDDDEQIIETGPQPKAEHHARGGEVYYERIPLRSYGLVPQPDGGHLRQMKHGTKDDYDRAVAQVAHQTALAELERLKGAERG